jgi:hypothetical protein
VRRLCQVSLQNKVSIGSENFVLNTVGFFGVSIGESLSKKEGLEQFNMGYSPILNWLGSDFQGKQQC